MPVLLLQEEVADEHRFDAGRVEAADGVARRADEGFAEEIERRVVEHGQSGGTPQTMPAARAAAAELAMRAASALVVANGSRSILTDADPQRLAREAIFLLVF